MNEQQKILEALTEKPSRYTIEVSDSSMLPDKLKGRKSLDFVVKPPTLEVLAKCAIPLQRIPGDVLGNENLTLAEALSYRKEMVEVFSIMAHGKDGKVPDWYPDFVLKNVTGKELFCLFQEIALKMQSDFFLKSFQVAKVNPMMMTN